MDGGASFLGDVHISSHSRPFTLSIAPSGHLPYHTYTPVRTHAPSPTHTGHAAPFEPPSAPFFASTRIARVMEGRALSRVVLTRLGAGNKVSA